MNLSSLFPINLPAEADVKVGVTYGRQLEKTGALAVKDPATGLRVTSPQSVQTLAFKTEFPFHGDVFLDDFPNLYLFEVGGCSLGDAQLDVRYPASTDMITWYDINPYGSAISVKQRAALCATLSQFSFSTWGVIDLSFTLPPSVTPWGGFYIELNGARLVDEEIFLPEIVNSNYSSITIGCWLTTAVILHLPVNYGAPMDFYIPYWGTGESFVLVVPEVLNCITFDSMQTFPSATVDELLMALVAGGAEYGTCFLGNSGVPGAAGQSAAATLVSRGWSVQTAE